MTTALEQLVKEKEKATTVYDNGSVSTIDPIYNPEPTVVAIDAILELKDAQEAGSTGGGYVKSYAKAIVDATALASGANTFSVSIPDNAIIVNSLIDVTTTVADDGTDASTIGIGVETVTAGSEDIVNAIAISDGTNPWDAGIKAGVPVSAATAVKTTGVKNITVNVVFSGATEFSAGAFDVYVEYFIGE